MSESMTPLPPDDPIMVAWERYKMSPEYLISFKWAAQEEYRDGSLWAAFFQGWNGHGGNMSDHDVEPVYPDRETHHFPAAARVKELEAEVAKLTAENADLRRIDNERALLVMALTRERNRYKNALNPVEGLPGPTEIIARQLRDIGRLQEENMNLKKALDPQQLGWRPKERTIHCEACSGKGVHEVTPTGQAIYGPCRGVTIPLSIYPLALAAKNVREWYMTNKKDYGNLPIVETLVDVLDDLENLGSMDTMQPAAPEGI